MDNSSGNPSKEFIEGFIVTLEAAGLIQASQKLDPVSASMGEQDFLLEELGVDSFTLIAISVKIEENYSLSISPEKLASTKSLMAIVRAVAAGVSK